MIMEFIYMYNLINYYKMEKIEVLNKVQDIFRDVLDNEEIVLNMEMSASDIEEYDSLAHIQLVVAIEKAFGIKFTSSEIVEWKKIGDMVNCIASK